MGKNSSRRDELRLQHAGEDWRAKLDRMRASLPEFKAKADVVAAEYADHQVAIQELHDSALELLCVILDGFPKGRHAKQLVYELLEMYDPEAAEALMASRAAVDPDGFGEN